MRIKNERLMQMLALLVVNGVFLWGCSFLNDYQDNGKLKLAGLSAPVKVLRDEKGMAYIYAQNRDDAMMAHGFVTAQDRLFQMEVTRRLAQGRICELAGERALALDIRMRTIGFFRNAKQQAAILAPEPRRLLQRYIDGVNAYIETRQDTHHLEFKLAGIAPTKWTVQDSLSLAYFLSWDSAANLKTEIIAQMLVDALGPKKAKSLFPLNINPDDPSENSQNTYAVNALHKPLGLALDPLVRDYLSDGPLKIGSNNWVVSSRFSPGGKPILANDPHLDARILPGPWYPCALITPDLRVVGTGFPGLGGMIVFRQSHVAVGVTNSYGDAQDLYVETVDPQNPDHYLEGGTSIPFSVLEENLTIKDKKAPDGIRQETIQIRLTHRGPVVSDIFPKLKTDKVLTLRWAPFETIQPEFPLDKLLYARSVAEVRSALEDLNIVMLNFVFADVEGNIGWQTSGKLPIREQKDGTLPHVVSDGSDNWKGWIPFQEMPHAINPEKGWVGTCNHYTPPSDYPYYYSSHASSSFRYRRLKQLLEQPGLKTAEDHWQYQRDTLNLMAKTLAPIMARALEGQKETAAMARILSAWDFHDDADLAAPAVFQATYRLFALMTFQDELGGDLSRAMLDNWYFWQEKLFKMVIENDSPWFDDTSTEQIKETRDDLFLRAGREAAVQLKAEMGDSPDKWAWGKIHTIEHVSPIRREGFGKGLLGSGRIPVAGSSETLLRNYHGFNKPFDVIVSDSMRMVADLGDPEKVLAVLPGGVSGRLFHPHTKDQVKPFISGEKVYWWLSDEAIHTHTQTTLVLNPSS
jgi:penicillin amidase